MDFESVPVGSWVFQVGNNDTLPRGDVNGLEQFVNTKWLPRRRAEHPEYPWAGLEEWKIPSPIIRIDMGPSDASGYGVARRVMEVEDRPGGLGVMMTLCPETIPLFREALAHCDGFVSMGGPIRGDDAVAAAILEKPFYDGWYGPKSGMYWVRHDTLGRNIQYPSETLLELERCSIVPVRADGCKVVLIDLGLAYSLDVYLGQYGGFPWETGFCIKPKLGTWATDVHVYHPHWTDESATRTKIARETAEKEGSFLLQPLIPPRTARHNGRVHFEVQRVFLTYDPRAKCYRVAGGITMGVPSLKVHGRSDCYSRRITIEK